MNYDNYGTHDLFAVAVRLAGEIREHKIRLEEKDRELQRIGAIVLMREKAEKKLEQPNAT